MTLYLNNNASQNFHSGLQTQSVENTMTYNKQHNMCFLQKKLMERFGELSNLYQQKTFGEKKIFNYGVLLNR